MPFSTSMLARGDVNDCEKIPHRCLEKNICKSEEFLPEKNTLLFNFIKKN